MKRRWRKVITRRERRGGGDGGLLLALNTSRMAPLSRRGKSAKENTAPNREPNQNQSPRPQNNCPVRAPVAQKQRRWAKLLEALVEHHHRRVAIVHASSSTLLSLLGLALVVHVLPLLLLQTRLLLVRQLLALLELVGKSSGHRSAL
jgi:Na+-transporting methylmalonyl-CoA/oxaloacetate decarboxylase gamma subunit